MRYRLAAIDLDATLLDSKNQLSETNAAALRGLVARGVIVAPATARWYQVALRPFEALGLQVAAIAGGGSDVRAADGTVIAQHLLPGEFVSFFAELCDRAGWRANLSTSERTFRRDREAGAWASRAPSWLVPVTSLGDVDLTGLLSVLAHSHEADPFIAELEEWAGRVVARWAGNFDGDSLLTITAAGVDKGSGLAALCSALGIDPSEAVVFGDSEVDLPMFEVAGLAVAMGNASAEVQARAGFITASADDDGVARAIERIWPG